MVKKNKILVACLALLLVLSVGYALFSETITINGTATAKGSFDITYACEVAYAEGGTGTCTIENGVIKTTSTLTKPTDVVGYKVTITNSGAITAVLKTVTTPNNMTLGDFTGTAGDAMYYDTATAFTAHLGYEPEGSDVEEEGVFSEAEIEGLNLTIANKETLIFYVIHGIVDMGEKQPVLPTNGATLNYNVSLGFEQVAVQ